MHLLRHYDGDFGKGCLLTAPTTGSAMKAQTFSGPTRWNSASSSAASRAT